MESKNLYGENKTEWYRVKLRKIVDYKKGYAFKSDSYKCTGVRIVKISDTTESSIKSDNVTCIDVEKYNEYKEWSLVENDVIISTVGSRPPLYDSMVGKVIKVPASCNNALLNQNMVRLRAKENVKQEYLFYLLKTRRYLNHIENICRGNANQVSITLDELFEYKIDIPPLKEQEKIVEILSTWDLAIEKQEQLIEKKKEFKKGLMQRLLSGEVRFKEFKDEWNERTLENYIIPVSRECDKPNEGYWRLGLRSHGKGTFHEFVEDPSTVSMDKLYKVKNNDLIVNITFAWEHAIAIANSDDEEKLVSHRFPTYEFKENAYPLFFKYYILQSKFKNMLVNISPGGAGRNRVMSKKDFLKLTVKVPSYNEQVKISEVLISSDKEIELLQKELEALKLQKKGLMQRLLTGEVRVDLD